MANRYLKGWRAGNTKEAPPVEELPRDLRAAVASLRGKFSIPWMQLASDNDLDH